MHSTSPQDRRPDRHRTNRSCRVLAQAICLTACAWSWQCANAQEGGVYIAGQGASLREAFDQALAENPGGARRPFWIVLSGEVVADVTKTGASRDVRDLIQRIRTQRGLIYACRSDMSLYGIAPGNLLDGVKPVRGFEASTGADEAPIKQRGVVLPKSTTQARLILRTCAERDKADVGETQWARNSHIQISRFDPHL